MTIGRRKAWALRNPGYVNPHYLNNRESVIAKATKRNSDNPEAHRAANAKWRKNNPSYTTEWHRKNKDKSRAIARNRRARKNMAAGAFSAKEWSDIVEAYGNLCAKCGSGSKVTADHIVPLSRGGSNLIGNIQPLCRACNASKGTRTIWFRPYLRGAMN